MARLAIRERLALAIAAILMLALSLMGWASFTKETPTTLIVHLRRGDTGEALPNHEIWYQHSRGLAWSSSWEASFMDDASRLRSDANGVLRVEFQRLAMRFFARHDHLVGRLSLSGRELQKQGKSEVTLELHPERPITIRTLDPNGRAVSGIRISRSSIYRPSLWSQISSWVRGGKPIRWSYIGETATPDEPLIWQDLVHEVQDAKRSGKILDGFRFRARVPGHEEVSLDLRPIPADGSTIDLQLPSTGELKVRFLDSIGNPIPGIRTVNLRHLHLDRESGEFKPESFARRGLGYLVDMGNARGLRDLENGIATFPALALGEVYRISVRPRRFDPYGMVTRHIVGPTTSNPSVTRDLILDEGPVILQGRAIDADGNALRSETLYSYMIVDGRWVQDRPM